jgi:hypothetical protein
MRYWPRIFVFHFSLTAPFPVATQSTALARSNCFLRSKKSRFAAFPMPDEWRPLSSAARSRVSRRTSSGKTWLYHHLQPSRGINAHQQSQAF